MSYQIKQFTKLLNKYFKVRKEIKQFREEYKLKSKLSRNILKYENQTKEYKSKNKNFVPDPRKYSYNYLRKENSKELSNLKKQIQNKDKELSKIQNELYYFINIYKIGGFVR
jgi:hypothetical protein